MNPTRRYIISEHLHLCGSLLIHTATEMYLATHKHRDGLTDAEYDFLEKLHARIIEDQRKLYKIQQRLVRGASVEV